MLILNMVDDQVLPRNFRMSTLISDNYALEKTSLEGMNQLRASGSGQFSQKSLETLLNQVPSSNLIFVDLREESHGFINGAAASWYVLHNTLNVGKTSSEILDDEIRRLQILSDEKYAHFYHSEEETISLTMEIQKLSTEQKLVEDYGQEYFRLPCTDHRRPSDDTVDEFVDFIINLPADTWLHFHCSAGVGRTSTFMVMQDMIINASKVSFEDILSRQKMIGGKDFWLLPEPDSWKYESLVDRQEFLRKFYDYCKDQPDFAISWQDWLKNIKLKSKTGANRSFLN